LDGDEVWLDLWKIVIFLATEHVNNTSMINMRNENAEKIIEENGLTTSMKLSIAG